MGGKTADRRLGLRMLALVGAFVIGLSVVPGSGGVSASPGAPAASPASQEQQVGLPYEAFDEFYRNSIFDCNANDIPDDWEYVYGGQPDEDYNGLLDVCEAPAVGVGGVPSHGRLYGRAPLLIQRTEAGTYLFSLHIASRGGSHDARIDIVQPAGRFRTTIMERAITIDTTVAWRAPKRWPDGSRFQRGFYDIIATVGRQVYRATVFLERGR